MYVCKGRMLGARSLLTPVLLLGITAFPTPICGHQHSYTLKVSIALHLGALERQSKENSDKGQPDGPLENHGTIRFVVGVLSHVRRHGPRESPTSGQHEQPFNTTSRIEFENGHG